MSQSDSSERAAPRKSTMRRVVCWATPGVAVLGGVAYFASSTIGGHPALGIGLLTGMVAAAAALLLAARRSETIRGLINHRDERINGIDLRATAFSGLAVILAILVGALVEMGRGHSGAPYTWLAAIAGLSYILAIVVLRVRQ